MKKKKVRKQTILAKIMTAAGVCIAVASISVGMMGYLSMQNKVLDMAADKAKTIGIMAAREIDWMVVDTLKVGDEDTPGYKETRTRFATIMRQTGLAYMYTLYEKDGVVYYGIDGDQTEEGCAIGEVFEVGYDVLMPAFEHNQTIAMPEFDKTEDGEILVTSYVPILDDTGLVVGVLGIDYDARALHGELSGLQGYMMLLMAGGILLI